MTTGLQQGARPAPAPRHSGGSGAAPGLGAALAGFGLRYATVLFAVGLLIATTYLYPGFWDVDNLRNILSQNAPIGIVAVGMTVVIIAGGFDLSAGAVFAAGGVFYASVADEWALEIGFAATLAVGAAAGLINGIVATKMNVNSLIATIGTGAAFSGLTYLYCDSKPIPVEVAGFDSLGLGTYHGVPWAGLLLIGVCVGVGLVMSGTVYGRWIYAVGGNSEAARVSGIRVDAVRASAFVLVGTAAALAGALSASQLGVGQPTVGDTVALDAFTIVVIGGISVYGGQGALWRTAVGLLIVAVMSNLFNSLSLDTATQLIAKGGILVGALGIDAYARTRGR